MARARRVVVAVLAAVLSVVLTTPPAVAVGNTDAAARAARWVAAQEPAQGDVGSAADSLLALTAAGDVALAPQAARLLQVVEQGAASHAAASPAGAAKLALVAAGLGRDPRNFHGTDLVAAVRSGVHPDGSFGAQPGAAASGLGLVALTRAQEPIPPGMLPYLVRSANPDGGFGTAPGRPSDAESTGLAILGLLSQTDSISARDAVTRAVVWATAQQQADGSWHSDTSPVVATAVLGSALQAAGQPQPRAVQYLVSRQLPEGALPGPGGGDLGATQRAVLLLADTTYAAVGSPALAAALTTGATAPSSPPAASGPAQPTATSVTTPAQPTGTTAAPAPATETAAPAAPRRTDGIGASGVILLVLLLLLLGGAAYMMFGRHHDDPPPAPVTPPRTPEPGPAAPSAPAAPADADPAAPTAAEEFGLVGPADAGAEARDPDADGPDGPGGAGRSPGGPSHL